MPFVDVNNEKIHYAHYDAGSDINLVLVHGSGGSHANWPMREFELSSVNVFAPDLPGHGESTGSGKDNVKEYCDVVDGFCKTLGLTNVVLAGHSLGGAITLTCALVKPAWLARIILVGTGSRLRVLPVIFEVIEKDFKSAVDMMSAAIFGPGVSQKLVEQEKQRASSVSSKIMLGDFTACDKFDVSPRLDEIDLPTLIISADFDKLTPLKYGQYLKDNIKDARLVVIKDAGHLMALERPDQFVSAITEFLL